MTSAKCIYCNGRGGFRGPYGWKRCRCQRPTATERAQQRAALQLVLDVDNLTARQMAVAIANGLDAARPREIKQDRLCQLCKRKISRGELAVNNRTQTQYAHYLCAYPENREISA